MVDSGSWRTTTNPSIMYHGKLVPVTNDHSTGWGYPLHAHVQIRSAGGRTRHVRCTVGQCFLQKGCCILQAQLFLCQTWAALVDLRVPNESKNHLSKLFLDVIGYVSDQHCFGNGLIYHQQIILGNLLDPSTWLAALFLLFLSATCICCSDETMFLFHCHCFWWCCWLAVVAAARAIVLIYTDPFTVVVVLASIISCDCSRCSLVVAVLCLVLVDRSCFLFHIFANPPMATPSRNVWPSSS